MYINTLDAITFMVGLINYVSPVILFCFVYAVHINMDFSKCKYLHSINNYKDSNCGFRSIKIILVVYCYYLITTVALFLDTCVIKVQSENLLIFNHIVSVYV